MKPDYEIIPFKDQAAWRVWLEKYHADYDGIWMRLYKKASGVQSITYAEALDEALCFGWIDGQVKSLDDKAYLQKFTPRRARSIWSKRNTEYIDRLIKAGRMTPAGQAEVDKAKADGRWDEAYGAVATMPEDFLTELKKHPNAAAFFETLNKSNRSYIDFHLKTAKRPETRVRRLQKIIETLEAQQKFL